MTSKSLTLFICGIWCEWKPWSWCQSRHSDSRRCLPLPFTWASRRPLVPHPTLHHPPCPTWPGVRPWWQCCTGCWSWSGCCSSESPSLPRSGWPWWTAARRPPPAAWPWTARVQWLNSNQRHKWGEARLTSVGILQAPASRPNTHTKAFLTAGIAGQKTHSGCFRKAIWYTKVKLLEMEKDLMMI